MLVHSALGPGLLEGAYQSCLARELLLRGVSVKTQVPIRLMYRDQRIDVAYRIDLVANDSVVVELKTVSQLLPIHEAQLLSYLKLGGYQVGLLINFHVRHLRTGIKRMVNRL